MSEIIDEDENYIYEILQEKDCIECATFLAHTFTKDNPYELFMKTTYEQFYSDALSLCKSILNTNLSVIARHKQTNEIHGIVQCVDAKTFNPEEHATSDSDGAEQRIDPIMDLMHQSEQSYMKEYEKMYGELKENSVAHILMVGVRSDCHGRGLGTKLNQVFLDHVRRRGFKHVIVDTSSTAIHRIYVTKLKGKVFTSVYGPTYTAKNTNGDDHRPFEHFDNYISFVVIDL
ncbi:unnamed protein product [Adineta steineri]|uniref:N-acetyltransferase domain-containing protein n=1 Tax=Adineta steineri TaxID=433720 RepID=A0A819S3H2_9BILA|nr:unnamed protein product [Adineta steineri]CAF1521087.1 unnamed protein product [Adineta steineri]CAF1533309.1 unnamed protein product [Adineta steineri]CAF4050537.1 unnamed protein product [Adineta steineri]CAF4236618.1 unnamed protein product [Adineta steineri]